MAVNPSVTDPRHYAAIADAIREKSGTSDRFRPGGMADAIRAIPSAASQHVDPLADVVFYDYDGTPLHSFTRAEALALTALPDGPTHGGLVFQGWNWTLGEIRAATTPVDVGALYLPESGATEIDIELVRDRLSPRLGIAINGTATVDWGDGSARSTVTGTSEYSNVYTQHVYAAPGKYTISIFSESVFYILGDSSRAAQILVNAGGEAIVSASRAYRASIVAVRLSDKCILKNYAFYACTALKTAVLGTNVPATCAGLFRQCFSLSSLAFPRGTNVIGQYMASNTNSMHTVQLPGNVTIASAANSLFIGNEHQLHRRIWTTSDHKVSTSCYATNYILRELKAEQFQSGVTTLSTKCFQGCWNLRTAEIPEGVTTIEESAFDGCISMTYLKLPGTLTKINSLAFSSCQGLALVDMSALTRVPTAGSNIFQNSPSDMKILVPAALLSEFQSHQYLGIYASQMVGV